MLGLTPDDFAAENQIEVWGDNARAVDVFASLDTQWRTGAAGAYGLDYAALPAVMDFHGIAISDRPELFRDIRTMEAAALDEIRQQRE